MSPSHHRHPAVRCLGALLGVAIWHAQLGKHITKVERNACGVSFLQIFSDVSFAIIIHITYNDITMDHHQLHNDNHTFWNWEGTPQFTSHLKPDQPVPGGAVIRAGCRWRGKKHGIAAGCCCQWPLHWRLRDLTKADRW